MILSHEEVIIIIIIMNLFIFTFYKFTACNSHSRQVLLKSKLFILLFQGLEVIEHTNLTYLTKEMTAEFYALKGMLLAQIGKLRTEASFWHKYVR